MSTYSSYSDGQLLRLTAAGDHRAFRAIFDKHRHRIYSYGFQLTKSADGANDIVQEVFLNIWKSRASLAEVTNLDAYITTIARNEFFKAYKQQVITRKRSEYLEFSSQVEDDQSPFKQMILKEQAGIISLAVTRLPKQQQLVYELSREKGMALHEIAEQLGISINTVKVHLTRALATLRMSLKNYTDIAIMVLVVFIVCCR